SRQSIWQEPIYRNVFGLLEEFGDAEIASLIAPRPLIVEHSAVPKIDGPPKPHDGRSGAAPGKLATPDYESVEKEVERSKSLVRESGGKDRSGFAPVQFVCGNEGMTTGPISDATLGTFLTASQIKARLQPPGRMAGDLRPHFNPAERQHRQVKELEEFTQTLLSRSETVRADFLWNKLKAKSPTEWDSARRSF